MDQSLTAEDSCGERNFHIAVDIHALSRPARLLADCDLKKQITCGTTAGSRHSFTCKTDALSGLDTCRNLNLQRLRSAARLVWILDRDGLFAAMNGLIEGYLDLRIQIVAPVRESGTGKSISAAKAMEAGTAKA